MFRNVNEVGEYLRHILSLSASLYSVGRANFSLQIQETIKTRHSYIGPLNAKIYIEGLTQLLVFMNSSIFCQLSVGGCSQATYQILIDVPPAKVVNQK